MTLLEKLEKTNKSVEGSKEQLRKAIVNLEFLRGQENFVKEMISNEDMLTLFNALEILKNIDGDLSDMITFIK